MDEIPVETLWTFAVLAAGVVFVGALIGGLNGLIEKRRIQKEKNLIRKIRKTSRSDFISGYLIVRELGWVNVADCHSTQEVEENLKLRSAQIGANGIIKLHWNTRKERYINGYGTKGNQHYSSRNIYNGEGVAVEIEKKEKGAQKRDRTETVSRAQNDKNFSYSAGWVAVDGNNVFGVVYDQTNDTDEAFDIFRKFLVKLSYSPYKTQLFWDQSFIKFLHATDSSTRGKNLEDVLKAKLKISFESLTISNRGQRADELIVPWSHAKSAAIVSNDKFSKEDDDTHIATKARELHKANRIFEIRLIAGEIIVPDLTSL